MDNYDYPVRVLLIPSSDYLGHPFPQRHNHIFERIHDGRDFEVHIVRFNIFGRRELDTSCVVHEIPLEVNIKNTALYYLSNVFSYTHEIMRIIKQESIDIVVAGNILPPLTYLLTRELVEKSVPFIFDLQDYYPTSATGYIAEVDSATGTLLKGLFELLTQYIIRRSNVVTVPGVALSFYAKESGAKRVEVIPNGISDHFLLKHNGRKVRSKLGLDDEDLVVGYLGSIEFWLDMEPLIKAISKTVNKGLPVKLMLIGKHLQTGYPRKVEQWIKKYDIEKSTIWLDFVKHENVPEYIAAMDIGTIPFDVNNPTAYYAAPNKLWEYMSQGARVVSTPIPDVVMFRKYVDIVFTAEDYEKVISGFKKDSNSRVDPGVDRLMRTRTWENSARKFRNLLINVKKKRI